MNRICHCARRITHTLVHHQKLVVKEELLFVMAQKNDLEEQNAWIRDHTPLYEHYYFDIIESPGGGSVEYAHQ